MPNDTRVPLSWINGQENTCIPVTDRGLQYGDGLFETCLYLNHQLVLEKEHLARLQRDALRLQLNLDRDKLQHELQAFLCTLKDKNFSRGVIKILLTREYTGRGYRPDPQSNVQRILQYFEGVSYAAHNRNGISLALLPYRLAIHPALAGIKHLNRLEQVLAQANFKQPLRGIHYSEGVLLDQGSFVTECMSSNLFWVKDRTVFTPLLDRSGVQGVMRDFILQQVCPLKNITVVEGHFGLDALWQADEVWICNSVYGVWPVAALEVKSYPVGPVTRAIQAAVDELGYGIIHH